MIALLGSLIGFSTSFLPQILAYFQSKQDHKNRMEELRLKGEIASLGVQDEIAKLDKQAEVAQMRTIYSYANPTKGFAAGLSASVRPVLTYGFFMLFLAVKVVILLEVMEDTGDWKDAVPLMLDPETQALFSSIVCFWFGSRASQKFMKR